MSDFQTLRTTDLRPTASIPQCLDNHWLPNSHLFGSSSLSAAPRRSLLEWVLRRKSPQTIEEWEQQIARIKRSEYIRSLITTEQVIINRAFPVGLRTIYQDFIPSSPHFESFQSLINDGSWVVYLAQEERPIDVATASFPKDPQAAAAWRRLCQDSKPHCIRLSWDSTENSRHLVSHLGGQFARRLQNLHLGEAEQFLRDIRGADNKIELDDVRAFRRRLQEVANTVSDVYSKKDRPITRTELYAKFVQTADTPPEVQRYDTSKKYFAEIKQLTDLIYNTNLSNVLGVLTLTPTDSPTRLALQELQTAAAIDKGAKNYLRGADLGTLIADLRFAVIHQALNFIDFGALTIADVVRIRSTEEWAHYIDILGNVVSNEALLDSLDSATNGLVALEDAYYKLLGIIVARYVSAVVTTDNLKPAVKLVIETGTEYLALDYFGGGNPVVSLGSKVANSQISDQAANVIVSWNIGWISGASQEFLSAGTVQLAKRRFKNVREDWGALIEAVRSAHQVRDTRYIQETPTTINQSVESGWDVW